MEKNNKEIVCGKALTLDEAIHETGCWEINNNSYVLYEQPMFSDDGYTYFAHGKEINSWGDGDVDPVKILWDIYEGFPGTDSFIAGESDGGDYLDENACDWDRPYMIINREKVYGKYRRGGK